MEKREHDFSTKEGTIDAIIFECIQNGFTRHQLAYVLATVEHETNNTFKPVREAYWLSENWRKKNLRYYPYYGRGYVQITWQRNYDYFSKLLKVDMVKDPDIAMRENVSLFILVHGFKNGTFTGKKISDYINSNKVDFKGARRCINGTDCDVKIAKLAEKYLKQL
jgi:hypothetical protein